MLRILCGYIANIVNISVFNTLSIDSGIVVAVLLCVKRELHNAPKARRKVFGYKTK